MLSNTNGKDRDSSSSKGPWLHAWYDPLASLRTTTALVRLVDINSDGDFKLLVGDLEKKLKVYKNTSLVAEHALLDTPTAMAVIYSDQSAPIIPCIAVAAG